MVMEYFHHHHNHPPFHFNNGCNIFMAENRVKTEKWVKHYSSFQRILLVGEGDFSFSLSLARQFGSATNICATSLNSYDTLINTYKNARLNLWMLRDLGATLVHEVDAKTMKDHPLLNKIKFDCIVYNFPHAGFYGKEDDPEMIKMHQGLVHGFFGNARWLLAQNGEIHVTHKTKPPYSYWNLEQLARENSLLLMECVPFDSKDYTYYENKRGHGPTIDESFDCRDSWTFKFAVAPFPTSMAFNYHPSTLHNSLRQVKFIVKAEVSLYLGVAGCAGAVVDENHSIRAQFCGPLPLRYCMDIDAASVAELLAIKFAVLMFERSELCGRNMALVVVTDSNHAVSWIKSNLGNPESVLADLEEIRLALNRIPNRVDFCSSSNEYGSKQYTLVRQLAVEALRTPKMYESWLPDDVGGGGW